MVFDSKRALCLLQHRSCGSHSFAQGQRGVSKIVRKSLNTSKASNRNLLYQLSFRLLFLQDVFTNSIKDRDAVGVPRHGVSMLTAVGVEGKAAYSNGCDGAYTIKEVKEVC